MQRTDLDVGARTGKRVKRDAAGADQSLGSPIHPQTEATSVNFRTESKQANTAVLANKPRQAPVMPACR
jgi:hypothetical protein